MNAFPSWPVRAGAHRVLTADAESLAHWAREVGEPFMGIALHQAQDKAQVMADLALALGFPEGFGANLDALHDCLTDPAFAPRGVLLLIGVRDVHGLTAEALIEVFDDASRVLGEAGCGLRVYWSPAEPVAG